MISLVILMSDIIYLPSIFILIFFLFNRSKGNLNFRKCYICRFPFSLEWRKNYMKWKIGMRGQQKWKLHGIYAISAYIYVYMYMCIAYTYIKFIYERTLYFFRATSCVPVRTRNKWYKYRKAYIAYWTVEHRYSGQPVERMKINFLEIKK